MATVLDYSRPPNKQERSKFERRLRRLERPGLAKEIEEIRERMPGSVPSAGLLLREGFAYREKGISVDASDRKAPPREQRPSATRLITSRGAALRFALMVLAVTQANRKAGSKAHLSGLGIASAGNSDVLGWTDLVASDAEDTRNPDAFITARDKRARTVRTALGTMEESGLAIFPDRPGSRGRYESFILLDERGKDVLGEAEEYRVPRKPESTFSMAREFITNGWIHVLEDSEIALLLMVACGKGAWPDGGLMAMPSETRLRNYGIHRDSFSAARKTLEWFGLLHVKEFGRHDDGRAEQVDLQVHRLGLVAGSFEAPSHQLVVEALRQQLSRR